MSQKTLCHHAESLHHEFPLAANAIIEDTYMDDTIKSMELEDNCCQLVKQLSPLVQGLDMKIQKFYSNSLKVLKCLPKDCLSTKVHFEDKDAIIEANKVLGMIWDASTDNFKYNSKFANKNEFFNHLNLKTNCPEWTKRLILKLSATCYDPLGLISPFTVKSRSILQELWKEELTWDQSIPDTFQKQWNDWMEELFQLSNLIQIPRFLQFKSSRIVEIHVFADASTKVFATCVYARVLEFKTQKRKIVTRSTLVKIPYTRPISTVTADTSRGEETGIRTSIFKQVEQEYNIIDVSLVTAKARVTPSKTESVSRLELGACVIATRMGNVVAQAYGINPDTVQYWTDSKNCLFWLNTPSSVLKTFVSHRVGEIQNNSLVEKWRHVPTDQNPADIPTRMPKITELAKNKLWWKGPDFLMKKEIEWPPIFVPPSCDEDAKDEFKKTYLNASNAQIIVDHNKQILNPDNYSVGSVWDGFDKLLHLTRLVMTCLYKNKSSNLIQKLAIEYHLKKSQQEDSELSELIESLKENPNKGQSHLTLLPYVENGLLKIEK